MALIKCKECKKEISSKAKKCPHCGVKIGTSLLVKVILGLFLLMVLGNLAKTNSSDAPVVSSSKPVPKDNWQISRSVSEMSNTKTIIIGISAESPIQAWLSTPTPKLIIRCKEKSTDVFVNTGTAAQPEYGNYDSATVRLKLDDDTPYKEEWNESTDKEALFAPRAVNLARKLVKAKKFLFEFTPHNANPQIAKFDLNGIEKYLPEVANTCGWQL